MHQALKLVVLAFAGTAMAAGAMRQPARSAEQMHPISDAVGWSESSMLSIAPRTSRDIVSEANGNPWGKAAPSKPALRLAQSDCRLVCAPAYQQQAAQCEAFRMFSDEQYRLCIMAAQSYAQQCMQACASGVYPGGGQNHTLCDQFPSNPQCR